MLLPFDMSDSEQRALPRPWASAEWGGRTSGAVSAGAVSAGAASAGVASAASVPEAYPDGSLSGAIPPDLHPPHPVSCVQRSDPSAPPAASPILPDEAAASALAHCADGDLATSDGGGCSDEDGEEWGALAEFADEELLESPGRPP